MAESVSIPTVFTACEGQKLVLSPRATTHGPITIQQAGKEVMTLTWADTGEPVVAGDIVAGQIVRVRILP